MLCLCGCWHLYLEISLTCYISFLMLAVAYRFENSREFQERNHEAPKTSEEISLAINHNCEVASFLKKFKSSLCTLESKNPRSLTYPLMCTFHWRKLHELRIWYHGSLVYMIVVMSLFIGLFVLISSLLVNFNLTKKWWCWTKTYLFSKPYVLRFWVGNLIDRFTISRFFFLLFSRSGNAPRCVIIVLYSCCVHRKISILIQPIRLSCCVVVWFAY